jgi:uncharacterized protein (DUF58 family)
MIPAQRVYHLLLLGTAIGLLLFWGDHFSFDLAGEVRLNLAWVVTLLWDGAVLGLAIWDAGRVQSHSVEVERQPLSRLSIGRENPVRLTVRSACSTRLQLRDYYPAEFTAKPAVLQLTLAAGQQELTYSVFPTRRGTYDWGPIQVRQLGPWQLAWHDWQIVQPQTVAVYPDLLGLQALSLRLTVQSSGTLRRVTRTGMGTEFAELREYSRGDDPRLIDWKATARRDRPLLRVLEPEQEQTLIILLDRGRLMTAQVQV